MVKIQNSVSSALGTRFNELQKELSSRLQLSVDESPTKQQNDKAWLWVAVAAEFAVFGVIMTRQRKALKALIGDYSGIVINRDPARFRFSNRVFPQNFQ